MKFVSKFPSRKCRLFITRMWNGIVVLTPVTTYSLSARFILAIASSRSFPQATSFEMIGS
jgi:hypothetical protein